MEHIDRDSVWKSQSPSATTWRPHKKANLTNPQASSCQLCLLILLKEAKSVNVWPIRPIQSYCHKLVKTDIDCCTGILCTLNSLFFPGDLNSLKDSTTTRPFKRELESSVLTEMKYLCLKISVLSSTFVFLVTYLHQSCADPEKKFKKERKWVDKSVCRWGRRGPSPIFGNLLSFRYLTIQSWIGPTHQQKSPLWCNQ